MTALRQTLRQRWYQVRARVANAGEYAREHDLAAKLGWLTTAVGFLTVLVLVALGLWVVTVVPHRYIEHILKGATPVDATKRLELEDTYRKTVTQIVLGIFGLFLLYFTWRRSIASDKTVRIAEQGHITDRFTKAIEQLGKTDGTTPNIEVRLGAIYALERIALDSPRDHWTIMEVLTAYVRQNAPLDSHRAYTEGEKPRTDIQAILTVLGRRKAGVSRERPEHRLDLSSSRFCGAILAKANLQGANLGKVNLQGATLMSANLQDAYLSDAMLQSAYLWYANLESAHLWKANLERADLSDANLQRASLQDANLQGASLAGANLQRASLQEANLQGASLTGAYLKGASLPKANLEKATLRKANLHMADLLEANLESADLSEANLECASLVGANIQSASLPEANLERANLFQANLQHAYLSGGNLQHATLSNANLQFATLSNANLQFANLLKADLQYAYLPKTNLQDANLLEANLKYVQYAKPAQIQSAKDWQTAQYSPAFRAELGLSPEDPTVP